MRRRVQGTDVIRPAIRLLRTFCPEHLLEEIEGDLMQRFENDVKVFGEQKAKRRLLWNTIRFLRPGIVLRNRHSIQTVNTMMWKNYVKVATRNLAKRRLYAFINAVGLSIGIAFSILIYLYIKDERSFDQFHVNKENIYRVNKARYDVFAVQRGEDPMVTDVYLPLPFGDLLKDTAPEVQYLTRFRDGGATFRYGDKVYNEALTFVDADFFRMFSFPLLNGSPERIFTGRHEIVLTPEVAEKYFGNDDPVGKIVTLDLQGEQQFTVTGVVPAPPANSSLAFTILVPLQSNPRYERDRESWGSSSWATFIQLHAKASVAGLKTTTDTLIKRHMGDQLERWRAEWKVSPELPVLEFTYTKLTDIHLNTEVGWHKVSNPEYSWILSGIALLIIIIGSTNYISLALTTSASRRIEVGIRKVTGAKRNQIIMQFTTEAMILALISMIIGLGLVVLLLPSFNEFTGKAITLSPVSALPVIGTSFVITMIIGLTAGSYPAIFLSRFVPVVVLRSGGTSRFQAGFTRPLVVFQFFLSASMIISSVIMYQQMKFIADKDLGYDKEHVVAISTQAGGSENADKVIEQFRNKMSSERSVLGIAGTSTSFSRGWSHTGYKANGEFKSAYVYRVDPAYIPLLGLELKEGRNFDERIASDNHAVIVNEALVRDMGWEKPLEEYLNWTEDTVGLGAKVIGVVRDYHILSLESNIEPVLLSMDKKRSGYLGVMLVKLSPGNMPEKIGKLKDTWSELYPGKPFEYSFIDEDVANQYRSHNRWMNIAALSSGFAIFIASIGLFGLAGINAVNRTREIGIRKVMGADAYNIFFMLNKQYTLLAAIAFALAVPFSWHIMTQWLAGFKYTITIGWQLFTVSMLCGLTLALITVSYHAIKASLINPAETLKHE